ncbi:MAG: hypothetical protein ACRC3J_05090 [Culicoidibacterales bacterium]
MKVNIPNIIVRGACSEGVVKLLSQFNEHDVEINEIIESNDIRDAIWALRCTDASHEKLIGFACGVLDLCDVRCNLNDTSVKFVREFIRGEKSFDDLTYQCNLAYNIFLDSNDCSVTYSSYVLLWCVANVYQMKLSDVQKMNIISQNILTIIDCTNCNESKLTTLFKQTWA